ncbi:hypothetical protein HYH03_014441 [Edaphochlamys debaryana]|uniref:U-box domain-containing protein n=1 Tax=Edaphochlamys debaryana TaxID=47281 RepID=A0A836BTJ6_9CHLO|nr:hypothetical protein HYH03_014441 [Edaphochlamys debaryana]|eukprot:KAG2486943.1 hypothetical protein HYH03_014441 [Edaphochlamys debaryana]
MSDNGGATGGGSAPAAETAPLPPQALRDPITAGVKQALTQHGFDVACLADAAFWRRCVEQLQAEARELQAGGAAEEARYLERVAGALGLNAALKVPSAFVCPISRSVMREPVVLKESPEHCYEREAITQWLLRNDVEPLTRKLVKSRQVVLQISMRDAIQEWLAEHELSYEQADAMDTSSAPWVAPARTPPPRSRVTSSNGAGGASSCGVRPSSSGAAEDRQDTAGSSTPSSGRSTAHATMSSLQQPADVAAALAEVLDALQARGHALSPGQLLDALRKQQAPAESSADRIKLLDYVTVAPGYDTVSDDSARGPLRPGKYGIVVLDDFSDSKPYKVRTLQEPYGIFWYDSAALERVPVEHVPEGLRLSWPTGEGKGTPVTPYTGVPGALVRRGYDWLNDDDCNGEHEEVGILLRPEPEEEDMLVWRVKWASGAEGLYYTGKNQKYELQHVQTDPTSGAPVMWRSPDSGLLAPGLAVTRGVDWAWGDQDGGGTMDGSLQLDDQEGHVAAMWPNHRLCRYRACPHLGYDLCYTARSGEPVTVYTAQAGLCVVRGPNWQWDGQDSDGAAVGVLLRPSRVDGQGVWWSVLWSTGAANSYRVGLPGTDGCDLQVTTYVAVDGSSRIIAGTPVVLAQDFARYGDARRGPLRRGAGKVGIVVQVDASRCKVLHVRTGRTFWYDRPALRPVPPQLAAAASKRLTLNRDGRAAFRGGDGVAGDTLLTGRQVFYCGARMHQCRCGNCDGQCGPSNGCPCHACLALIGKRVGPSGTLEDIPATTAALPASPQADEPAPASADVAS